MIAQATATPCIISAVGLRERLGFGVIMPTAHELLDGDDLLTAIGRRAGMMHGCVTIGWSLAGSGPSGALLRYGNDLPGDHLYDG
jgi:hypothetical protein